MANEQRFSGRVADYIQYRPSYPESLYELLKRECIIGPDHIIADIGCGTGFSSELFLKEGHKVFGVEPNAEMLNAARECLSGFDGFTPIQSGAEAIDLKAQQADVIFCAQAFHWLNRQKAKAEWRRIAKPGARVVIVWYDRDESTAFQRDYTQLIHQYSTDYSEVSHQLISEEDMAAFFSPEAYRVFRLHHQQFFDLDSLIGRTRSCSYMPGAKDAGYVEMLSALVRLFEAHQAEGLIIFAYVLRIYISTI